MGIKHSKIDTLSTRLCGIRTCRDYRTDHPNYSLLVAEVNYCCTYVMSYTEIAARLHSSSTGIAGLDMDKSEQLIAVWFMSGSQLGPAAIFALQGQVLIQPREHIATDKKCVGANE